ncbi:porin [Loktanella sp. D2R18]|uniref:porin n=1 Tax=Rhodobacterales TaxID=204455 RepID=UPI000DEA02FD|nr:MULTISPECIES: porin [Rhodobacterales]MDO6591998.1 porin [Yoonia sp. 1_MG-2023]RBW46180.1 porin [Loktanella sp. D2R18]
MKSTLLTTTALIAFGGAAAAEVSFSGSATLGYNDSTVVNATTFWGTTTTGPGTLLTLFVGDTLGDSEGFYWDANIAVTLSEELDNGLTATATFDFDVADDNNGETLTSGSYVLSLESETAGLFFGETAFAAETHWVSAGDMEADYFSAVDGETVLRGDVTFGAVSASLSYTVASDDGILVEDFGVNTVDQLSFGATAELGQFTIVVAYQEESDDLVFGFYNYYASQTDYYPGEVWGLSASATFGGADITVAYASDESAGETSTGVKVAYPFSDAITGTVYYVAEDDGTNEDNYGVNVAYASGAISVTADYQYDQGTDKWALEGSYDLGNGMSVFAGVLNDNEGDEDYYVAGTYDLGGGADLLISYAEDNDSDWEDEIGTNEYQEGATVEINFTF